MRLRRSHRLLFARASLATLLAAAALAGPAAPSATHASAHTSGQAVSHAHQRAGLDLNATDPRFGVAEASAQPKVADDLGARWTRIPFIWSYIQQTGPQSWNPFVLSSHGSDGVINAEIARGRNIVGLLVGSPDWAALYPSWHRASAPKNLFVPWTKPATDSALTTPVNPNKPTNYFGNYAYWLAKHYAGKIDQWIVWNEVSIPPTAGNCKPGTWTQWFAGCKPSDSVKTYAQMVEVAYQAIHAANPKAKLILYGDPYWYDKGAFEKALMTKLHTDDQKNGSMSDGYFDVANLHLYIGASTFYWIISDLRKQMASFGWKNKEIWVSETNLEPYDSPGTTRPAVRFRGTLEDQSTFLADAVAVYVAAKANRIEIYRMYDGPETAAGGAPMGLVGNNGKLRPIGRTFKFLRALYSGATDGAYTKGELYPDALIGGKAGVFKVVATKPGYHITTVWNQAGAHATYPKPWWTNPKTGVTFDATSDIVFPLHATGSPTTYDSSGTATYHFKATGTNPVVYDKFGHATTITGSAPVEINNRDENGNVRAVAGHTFISLSGGVYTVQLRGGTTYTNPDDPRIPIESGDPVIVLEQTN